MSDRELEDATTAEVRVDPPTEPGPVRGSSPAPVSGGNPEAARRAGINVERVRVIVFTLAGFMAGAGGIILASRLRSVSPSAGGGSLLLDVIAAAVIGGTSLFGGRGRVSSALLGALVITLINNGMDGLGLNSGVKFVVTGLVLLGAVLLDALSNRRSTS